MSKLKIETGSSPARGRFSITVTEEGPYLVYGINDISHFKLIFCDNCYSCN